MKIELFTTREVCNFFNKIAQEKRNKNELALSELLAIDFIVKLLNSEHTCRYVNNDVADLGKLIRKENKWVSQMSHH